MDHLFPARIPTTVRKDTEKYCKSALPRRRGRKDGDNKML